MIVDLRGPKLDPAKPEPTEKERERERERTKASQRWFALLDSMKVRSSLTNKEEDQGQRYNLLPHRKTNENSSIDLQLLAVSLRIFEVADLGGPRRNDLEGGLERLA